MQTTAVEFFSEGERISALWRDAGRGRTARSGRSSRGRGGSGLKDAKLYVRYHEALAEAGFGVLSSTTAASATPAARASSRRARQLEDLRNAVTYLTTRDDVDADAIGVFGTGRHGRRQRDPARAPSTRGFGPLSARFRLPTARTGCTGCAPSRDWLEFLAALDDGPPASVSLTGTGRRVHPREEIMVPTAERRTTTIKADVDDKIPSAGLASPQPTRSSRYRPIDAARGLRRRCIVIAVEGRRDDADRPRRRALRGGDAGRRSS